MPARIPRRSSVASLSMVSPTGPATQRLMDEHTITTRRRASPPGRSPRRRRCKATQSNRGPCPKAHSECGVPYVGFLLLEGPLAACCMVRRALHPSQARPSGCPSHCASPHLISCPARLAEMDEWHMAHQPRGRRVVHDLGFSLVNASPLRRGGTPVGGGIPDEHKKNDMDMGMG